MQACTKPRRPHRVAAALFLLASNLTATAEVSEAESRCVQAMTTAVDRMPSVLKRAQERTEHPIVADDAELFQDIGQLMSEMGRVCEEAKSEASDDDKKLIDEATSALTSYLIIYGLPGDKVMRDHWLTSVNRLSARSRSLDE